jgi:hypothetical protein
MLVKLLPDQISIYWDHIKTALVETTPELTARGITVILENLLCDSMQCWFELIGEDEDTRLLAILVTSIFQDNFFQANCLRICCLYGFDAITQQQWEEGASTLTNYAKSVDCVRIEAFTKREGLPVIAKKFGADVDFHISLEV